MIISRQYQVLQFTVERGLLEISNPPLTLFCLNDYLRSYESLDLVPCRFPVCAGIDPQQYRKFQSVHPFPRMCGDRPPLVKIDNFNQSVSPYVRG